MNSATKNLEDHGEKLFSIIKKQQVTNKFAALTDADLNELERIFEQRKKKKQFEM